MEVKALIKRIITSLLLLLVAACTVRGTVVDSNAAVQVSLNSEDTESYQNSAAPVSVYSIGDNSFADKKVACLGDSITAGLDGGTLRPAATTYPQFLQQMTGARVLNYGVGGSSIGTYHSEPMCIRYKQLPKDADYIVVYGGVNDAFTVDAGLFGSYASRRPGTFIGDLNSLFYGLKTEYPNSKVIVINPHRIQMQVDLIRLGHKKLVKQEKLSEAIKQLTAEYGFALVNLYDEGILNSCDARIRAGYVPDGCHPNLAGYEVLARLIAEKMIALENGQ